MVAVMVDSLMLLQMSVIQNVVDHFAIDPEHVPVIAFDFFVSFSPERVRDTILEAGLELDL